MSISGCGPGDRSLWPHVGIRQRPLCPGSESGAELIMARMVASVSPDNPITED